jgi:protein transport protein SEC61 subunit gamma-like protein
MDEYQQQQQAPTRWQKFKGFLMECRRVLKVTKKPTGEEFKTIVKVSGLGILLIGLIGFVIHFAKQILFR